MRGAARQLAGGSPAIERRAEPRLAESTAAVRSEKLGEVADEFDRVHDIERALEVGSVDRIIAARDLRPYLVDAVERGLAGTRPLTGQPVRRPAVRRNRYGPMVL